MVLTEKIKELLMLLEYKSDQVSKLEQELEYTKADLRKANAENVELQRKYDNLKIANGALSLSGGDVSEAKRKLTDIMNRIDVCVDRLSRQ
ncbi:MAG: hypothetical protein J6U24_06000 [Paludibacteraceae bacterium]|nr:hypothetical protein [Paludibacteraceae bacterium]